MASRPAIALALLPALIMASVAFAQTPPAVSVPDPHVDFGKAVRGAVIERSFSIRNQTGAALKIAKVRLTPPLKPAEMPVEIPAHQQAILRVELDTSTLDGPYEGNVLLSFSDPAIPDVRLTVSGRVALPLEVVPPAIFATAERGEAREASVEIVNHESEPVLIGGVRHRPERFRTRLETVEEGRRYRLTLRLNPDGPAGRSQETILLKTSSAAVPELKIAAFTYLRERVYTFPDAVDMGVLRLEEIRTNPDLLKTAAQTLMVYRKGTQDFQVKVSTDVPQLTLRAERGPQGDRYQITISLAPERLTIGTIQGSIVIDTNDPEFPKLTVPVSGGIVGSAGR